MCLYVQSEQKFIKPHSPSMMLKLQISAALVMVVDILASSSTLNDSPSTDVWLNNYMMEIILPYTRKYQQDCLHRMLQICQCTDSDEAWHASFTKTTLQSLKERFDFCTMEPHFKQLLSNGILTIDCNMESLQDISDHLMRSFVRLIMDIDVYLELKKHIISIGRCSDGDPLLGASAWPNTQRQEGLKQYVELFDLFSDVVAVEGILDIDEGICKVANIEGLFSYFKEIKAKV